VKHAQQRRASRLILLDRNGRVLLLRHTRKNGSTFWAPPGGGVERGETFEQAALREAEEELGLKGFPIKFLWERRTEFIYVETPVHQHECYFLLQAEVQSLQAETRKTHLREGITEMRWWAISAIRSGTETIFPEEIASEIEKILDDPMPLKSL
jgi:8-oxo-dGTP diphosphatase